MEVISDNNVMGFAPKIVENYRKLFFETKIIEY